MEKTSPVPMSVSADMTITKEDLIAIKVAEYEKDLIKKEKASRAEVTKFDTVLKNANTAATAELKKVSDKTKENKHAVAVFNNLESLGIKGATLTVSVDTLATLLSKKTCGDDITELNTYLGFSWKSGYGSSSQVHEVVKTPAKLLKAVTDIQQAQEDKTKAVKYALELKKSLGSIATLERQARAKLAEYALNNAQGGADLLDNLKGLDDAFLLPETTE